MKKIMFSKLNGQGNDFIIINAIDNNLKLGHKTISDMCNRNFGIGSDGLILVKKSNNADFKMDYYNQDGSTAEMCGNGIRCMAKFVYDNKLINRNIFTIETLAGIKKIEMDILDGKIVGEIMVDMGRPEFISSKIPVEIIGLEKIINYPIQVNNKEFKINCVSMGNPHCVIFLEATIVLEKFPVEIWGPLIEENSMFPNKTNVEFVKITGKNDISMRVWERGVGETLACGTGACASGVMSMYLKKVDGNNITVKLPGGKLKIIWENTGSKSAHRDRVYLKGKVSYNFRGEYMI